VADGAQSQKPVPADGTPQPGELVTVHVLRGEAEPDVQFRLGDRQSA
jgi:hypothetical protein